MDDDPDQDFIDLVNSQKSRSPGSSPGSPTATMTLDPDQDFIDMVNKSRSPTPTATASASRSPYTDKAIQDQSTALSPSNPGTLETIGGAAARGFLPGRAMLAAYPLGSVLGAAAVGAARGALVGAAVPIAGETGISEAVGGVLGGLIAGGIAAWGVHKLQTKAADVISPGGVFSSKTEQAQSEAHPYAAMVGGGLSFGKPNPMNVVRAGKTLASAEGRAALVAFTKTGGKGMAPKAVDEIGNVINVSMAGGLNSAFNVKDQIESGKFDPAQLAVAAATGLIFNEPWFHKANPAAAAAAKVMAKGGVPPVGPSAPTAPTGITPPEPPVAPGVVPPPTPRVPGLLDFETNPQIRPAPETARAPVAPLPEAPIPKPGTEGGITNATQERPVTESSVEEHPGVSPRENIREDSSQVRTVDREQTGDSGGTGAAAEKPVAPTHTDEISVAPADARTYIAKRVSEGLTREQALTEWQQKVAEHQAKMDEGLPVGSQVKTENGIFERERDGKWRATEDGGGKGVLINDPEGEIIRIGDPYKGKALPTGREPVAPVATVAIRDNETGEVIPGKPMESHGLLADREAKGADVEHGWVDTEGNFLNSQEAWERAKQANQLRPGAEEFKPTDRPPELDSIDTQTGRVELAKSEKPAAPVKVDPRLQRLEQIDQEISDHYDREELPPPSLHKERKAIEAELQKEHEASVLEEARGQQARGGDELLDAVAEHGVPLDDPAFPGELNNLKEHFAPKNKYGQEKHRPLASGSGEKLYFGDVFKAKAQGSMDSLTQFLKQKGFDVETPDDTINLIDERLRSGKKVYGDEARAHELEDQSFQDYQGPLYAKTEGEKWSPQKAWLPGRKKSSDQLDKDIAVAAKQEEGLPLPKSEPGTDIVATSQDAEQIDRLIGEKAYSASIVNVVIKELLQNGFDAVREGGASEARPGQISIDYDYNTRTITVRDDGVGMSPETIVTAFLRTGGTKKSGDHQNTSGGLGVAKLAFLKGSKRIKLVTVQNGLKSVIDVTREQIKANHIPLVKTYTNEPNGSTVTVEIPETYVNTKGETIPIHFDTNPEFLKNPLFGPVEVTVNGEKNHMGIHTEGWVKDNRFNFRWGHADVYVDPRPLEKYKYWDGTVPPVYRVLSAGLHQFEIPSGHIFDNVDQRIPHNMVIDVRPHVDTKDPQYPFDNQREGWRGSVATDAAAMYAYLKRQGLEQVLKKAQETFAELEVIPGIPMENIGKPLTAEQVARSDATKGAAGSVKLPRITSIDVKQDKVVTNYDTGKKDVQSHEQFTKPTFSAEREIDFSKSRLDTSHLKPEDPLFHNNTNVKFQDIPGAPELHSKVSNMLVHFMRAWGEKFGKDPTGRAEYSELTSKTPGDTWFGGISYDKTYAGLNIVNPFKAIWFNPAGISEGAMMSGPRRAAMESLHAFLHEITHVAERNEGGGFTREELNNVGRLVDFPQHAEFARALEAAYTEHWDTLNEIYRKYQDAGTANRAESFKAGSQLEPESSRGKRPDERVPGEHAPETVSDKDPGQSGTERAGEANPKSGQLGTILEAEKSSEKPGAEPAQPEVAAPAPEPERVPTAAPVPEGVSGRSGVAGIQDTLAGIREAAAQPPETPEQRQFAPRPVETGDVEPRPPTPNEAAGPGLRDLSDQQMSQVISNSLQKFHDPGITESVDASGGMSHNDIIDAGREAIRHGVDPQAVADSRAIPSEQKYTVVKAHAEDLREVAEHAENLARTHPTQENKDAAEAAFADYSNWDKNTVKPAREKADSEHPGMPPEEFNPRSMTDLRQQMIRQNDRDFTKPELRDAEQRLKAVHDAVEARNKELMKRDAELAKESPELVKEIKNGDDLFKYMAEMVICP